jgi:hypothetical protein
MEQMIGVKPDIRELHPFGCEVKVRSEPTSKAVPDRAISALFMGVSNGGVRVFNVDTGKMLTCRFGDCRIYDHVFPCNPTPGRELKLKYDAYRGGREEMDATDFELPLVIDDAVAADGRWKGRYAPGGDSAMQMIMDARTSLVRSGRTLHQEFNDALRLGRLDGQLCDRLWVVLPGVGGIYSPLNAPFLRDLREGSRMLKLPGFRGGLLESPQALAVEADAESIFRGEQGAAAYSLGHILGRYRST